MPKNILITAGGTAEPIDGVRSITNTGTGKLGSLIADSFSRYEDVEKIFYIHAWNSFVPQTQKAELVSIMSTEDLEKAVRKLCAEEKIDIVIHSMAVSDYRIRSVIPAELLSGVNTDTDGILDLFDRENYTKKYSKLPSSRNSPVILREPTTKVLPMFRQLLPEAQIVGFKLLDHVTHIDLIDTAYRLLEKNSCDYVLANDYATVAAGVHEGFLIDKNKNECRYIGKQAIADGIAQTLLGG